MDGKVPTRAIEGGVGCEHDTEIWNPRPFVRSILIIRKEFANSNANPSDNITLGIVTDCVYFFVVLHQKLVQFSSISVEFTFLNIFLSNILPIKF